MKRILPVILVKLFLAARVSADTPESLSEDYFDLLRAQEWNAISELYAPSALRDFREMMSFLNELPDEAADQVLPQFFGPGTTKATVSELTDSQYFAGFLNGVMAQAAAVGQLNFENVDILGSVPESDHLIHVLTRTNIGIGEMSIEAMEVISYEKVGEDWKIILQGKIKGMAQQIKAALSQPAPQ